MANFVDLLIQDNDIVVIDSVELLTSDLASLRQDIRHMILDSYVLLHNIAERNSDVRSAAYNNLTLLMEQDPRVIPGTVVVQEQSVGHVIISADTIFNAPVELVYEA